MWLIDTHAHLQEDAFRVDREEVLQRAWDAQLSDIIVVGFTVDSSRRAVELAEQDGRLHAVVGIQPNYVADIQPGDWDKILELSRHPKVVGIGETGLDLYWKSSPLDLQREYFQRHIALARELQLPFVVHLRDAEEPMLEELRKAAETGPLRGVMHSFTGGMETARVCWELGMHVSFAGMATFKNNHALRAVAAAVPADRIVIETDCPYLAPVPFRGKRNEPAWVKHTAGVLAETRGVSVESFAALTSGNARELFGLG